MAAFIYKEAAIFVGGHSSASNVRSFRVNGEATQVPSTTFGSGGFQQYAVGIKGATFEVGGIQNFDSDGLSTYLAAGVGTQYPFTVSLPGTAEGDPAWIGRGVVSSYGPIVGGTIDELGEFALTMQSDSKFGRGLLLGPLSEKSSASNTTGVAMAGPTASQSLFVALHITAVSSGTWTVLVESDSASNFASATTRITFDTFTGQGWQFKSVAGNFSTETHLRLSWSVAGGSSPTATFAAAAFVI